MDRSSETSPIAPSVRTSTDTTVACAEALRALLAHPVIRSCGWADRLFFRDAALGQPRVDPCEAAAFLGAVIAHRAPDAPLPDAVERARRQLEPARLTFLIANARRHELPLFRAAPTSA